MPHPPTRSPRWMPSTAVLVMLASGALLSGCAVPATTATSPADVAPSPTAAATPGETETAAPRVAGTSSPGIDPRCAREFPAQARMIDEAELEGRPDFWPEAPEWAALCWTEWENDDTQVGWYATDPGISQAEIYRHYEHALLGIGHTGRAQTGEGEIVTGVVPPRHSFWLISARDQYRVTWSFYGEYAD